MKLTIRVNLHSLESVLPIARQLSSILILLFWLRPFLTLSSIFLAVDKCLKRASFQLFDVWS